MPGLRQIKFIYSKTVSSYVKKPFSFCLSRFSPYLHKNSSFKEFQTLKTLYFLSKKVLMIFPYAGLIEFAAYEKRN
jgi:hypothetical protein